MHASNKKLTLQTVRSWLAGGFENLQYVLKWLEIPLNGEVSADLEKCVLGQRHPTTVSSYKH